MSPVPRSPDRDAALSWILVLGVGSLVFLVFGAWELDRRAGRRVEALGGVGRIEAGTATVHLWLEERVAGDAVDADRIRLPLEVIGTTWQGLRADLDGDPELRRRVEEIDFQLGRFEALTRERLERSETGGAVGIGTRSDQAYDSVFDDLGVALASLRVVLGDGLLDLRRVARLGLQALVVGWLVLIGTAGLLLRRRRRAHRLAESALAATQDRFLASQKMEAVGRLAGGIAHDINNYLAGINAQCELVLRRAASDEALAKRMRTVIATVFRASALIQQLLAFSRRQPTAPRIVDLDRVVQRLELMMVQLLGAGIRLETALGDHPLVKIDPVRLEQVLLNLIVNARDAMPEGGALEIRTARRGDRAVLEVRDQGMGMTAQVLERIFEPFFTTKSGSGASGLGLSTVLGIVEQAGGSLEVESQPGRGSTFRASWPAVEGAADAARTADEAEDGTVEGGSELVLLVEDNRELREASVALLRSQGYRVEAAGSGEELLELSADLAGRPDLLVADLVLPGIGGREVAERLRACEPDLALLFVTGYSDDPEMARRVREGEAQLLEKPYTSQSLLRRVREVLDARPNGAPGAEGGAGDA